MASTFTNPWQPSGRSTWPDSANDPEHGYMKLPGKKKMIRIRRTIYEDPGNPFQDELDAERRGAARSEAGPDCDKPLPEAPDEVSPTGRSFFELDAANDAESDAGRSGASEGMWLLEQRSPTARSFRFDSADDGSHHDGQEQQAGQVTDGDAAAGPDRTPAPPSQRRREHHRSMSLAMPSTRGSVASRRSCQRKNSLPLADGKATPASARDTRWYGFYEDLMRDYGQRRSGKP